MVPYVFLVEHRFATLFLDVNTSLDAQLPLVQPLTDWVYGEEWIGAGIRTTSQGRIRGGYGGHRALKIRRREHHSPEPGADSPLFVECFNRGETVSDGEASERRHSVFPIDRLIVPSQAGRTGRNGIPAQLKSRHISLPQGLRTHLRCPMK
jgi:hypothetical protein